MDHQDFFHELMAKSEDIIAEVGDDLDIEAIVGGFAMATAIMMDDVGVSSINIGNHTISIQAHDDE